VLFFPEKQSVQFVPLFLHRKQIEVLLLGLQNLSEKSVANGDVLLGSGKVLISKLTKSLFFVKYVYILIFKLPLFFLPQP